MPAERRLWSETELERWVAAGYASRISPAAGAGAPWVSPTFVVYGSKPGLVIELRMINLHIRRRIFKYQKLPSFLSTLFPGDHIVSWDVSGAFHHIRLRPEDREYFRFVVAGVLYEPRVLPFGMPLSPWVWKKLMRPVVAALRLRRFKIDAYVDRRLRRQRAGGPPLVQGSGHGRAC